MFYNLFERKVFKCIWVIRRDFNEKLSAVFCCFYWGGVEQGECRCGVGDFWVCRLRVGGLSVGLNFVIEIRNERFNFAELNIYGEWIRGSGSEDNDD
jgi:hypothetical protein